MLQFHSSSTEHAQAQQQQPAPSSQQQQQAQQASLQTLRLRDEPPPINAASAPVVRSRKRKATPAQVSQEQQQAAQAQQEAQAQQTQQAQQQSTQPPPPHILPPPHTLVQLSSIPGFYPAADYTTGGMPPGPIPVGDMQGTTSTPPANRTLSNSKRAEQNRKAQRAFRERRDQHVKALESRSQLLDAALASADEANRRWEECRALVDQLRIENAALRAELTQVQMLLNGGGGGGDASVDGGKGKGDANGVEDSKE